MKKTVVSLGVLLCISACAIGRLPKDYVLDTKYESVFIIGVAPDNYRISMARGKIVDGKFQPSSFPVLEATPERGFLVGMAFAGQTLAITKVQMVRKMATDKFFRVSGDKKTMTFNIPSGKVLYLGHIEYDVRNDKLFEKYSKDIDSAKSFIEKNYPNLRGRIEPWEYQLLHVGPFIDMEDIAGCVAPCIGLAPLGGFLW